MDSAEQHVGESRDADEIASAILEEAATSGCSADEVKAVKSHADRAKDERLVAEGALVAARAKIAREGVEAAATVADNRKADAAKEEARRAVTDINDLKAAANEDPAGRSKETKAALSKFAASVYDDAKVAASTVVPDKALLSDEVISKSSAFAAQAEAARKLAESASADGKEEAAKKAADDAKAAAMGCEALENEISKSGWYDASTKQRVHDDATKAAADAARAAKAVADLAERQALEAQRKAEQEAADKKAAEEAAAKGGLLSGALGVVGGLFNKKGGESFDEEGLVLPKKGDESESDHFYGVTHSRFYMMPDSEEGVRLRDLAKAAAQEVAKALADTRKAIQALNPKSPQKQAQSGADWKMNAINNAAAAVRRAQAKAKAVAELAEEAQQRYDRYHADPNATQKQQDRANATSAVVGGFSEVAQRDAKDAEKLFRSTHVIKPKSGLARRGTKGEIYEKNAPSQGWLGRGPAAASSAAAASPSSSAAAGTPKKNGSEAMDSPGAASPSVPDSPAESADSSAYKSASALAEEQGAAATMQSRQSNLMSTLGLSSSKGSRGPRSSSAGVNEVTTSLAFKIPDKEEGMKLRDIGKSYAEEAAKAFFDTKEAVKVMLDPESKARQKSSVAQGSLWKMHALNNAAAAKTRARVAASNCARYLKEARDRAERIANEGGDPEHVKAANATATVLEGFSKSANHDADGSNHEFDKTAVFKKRRDSDK
mmetsp:Transcript_12292/g.37109  ORF Transcript_12292/g.37109 Transcript_12292/m.37109 type:complete len:721 (-) Transcript_12292:594-2756(-)